MKEDNEKLKEELNLANHNLSLYKFEIEKLAAGNWTALLRDISGRGIFETEIKNQHSEIEPAGISAGTYFIELSNGTNKFTKRIVRF